MNYGVPYMGSKNRIANKIVSILPKADTFVDLFAGGCAITHAAMLTRKYSRFIANDITDSTKLFVDAVNGAYRDEKRWISRDDFFNLKDADPYVRYCWSFGNSAGTYLYAKEIEHWKKALHFARVFGDCTLLESFGIESDGSIADIRQHSVEYKKKYVNWYINTYLRKTLDIEKAVQNLEEKIERGSEELRTYLIRHRDANGLRSSDVDRHLGTNGMAGHYFGRSQREFPTREAYAKMREIMPTLDDFDEVYGVQQLHESLQRLESLESLQRLESLQSLQSLESLQRLESLQSLQRLQRLQRLESLQSLKSLQSLQRLQSDYASVDIPSDSVVYCDIPYRGTATYNGVEFDHDRFYDWALSRPYPVYVSEYSMPDGFHKVAEFKHRSLFSATAKNAVVERLFCTRQVGFSTQLSLF